MAETIGSLVDKLSIVGLKVHYMGEQVARPDASSEHRARCNDRLKILLEQQGDLQLELDRLIADVKAGRTKIKVYRQFKMYNDPVYRSATPSQRP